VGGVFKNKICWNSKSSRKKKSAGIQIPAGRFSGFTARALIFFRVKNLFILFNFWCKIGLSRLLLFKESEYRKSEATIIFYFFFS